VNSTDEISPVVEHQPAVYSRKRIGRSVIIIIIIIIIAEYIMSALTTKNTAPVSYQHRQNLRGVFCCRANMLYELTPAAAAATAAMLRDSSSFASL